MRGGLYLLEALGGHYYNTKNELARQIDREPGVYWKTVTWPAI